MLIIACIYRYRLYRDPTPDEDSVAQLTVMGKTLLSTLKRVFPFEVKVGRYPAVHVVQRKGPFNSARPKNPGSYG